MACLEEQGFPGATINADLTTSHQLTKEQDAGFEEAMVLCSAQNCPHCGDPPSTEDLTRLYHLEVEARSCLAGHGIEIDEPPTLQTFLAAPPEQRWSAHSEAFRELAGPEAQHIVQACPDPGTYMSYWQ